MKSNFPIIQGVSKYKQNGRYTWCHIGQGVVEKLKEEYQVGADIIRSVK